MKTTRPADSKQIAIETLKGAIRHIIRGRDSGEIPYAAAEAGINRLCAQIADVCRGAL